MLDLDPQSGFVTTLAIVALIVILFRDGLEVEAEMLQSAWQLPARKLVLAMPVTAAIVALATRLLTDLGWTECCLRRRAARRPPTRCSPRRRHEPAGAAPSSAIR